MRKFAIALVLVSCTSPKVRIVNAQQQLLQEIRDIDKKIELVVNNRKPIREEGDPTTNQNTRYTIDSLLAWGQMKSSLKFKYDSLDLELKKY